MSLYSLHEIYRCLRTQTQKPIKNTSCMDFGWKHKLWMKKKNQNDMGFCAWVEFGFRVEIQNLNKTALLINAKEIVASLWTRNVKKV